MKGRSYSRSKKDQDGLNHGSKFIIKQKQNY